MAKAKKKAAKKSTKKEHVPDRVLEMRAKALLKPKNAHARRIYQRVLSKAK
jgi:hypothetical protein